jgi:hypothetical protein
MAGSFWESKSERLLVGRKRPHPHKPRIGSTRHFKAKRKDESPGLERPFYRRAFSRFHLGRGANAATRRCKKTLRAC